MTSRIEYRLFAPVAAHTLALFRILLALLLLPGLVRAWCSPDAWPPAWEYVPPYAGLSWVGAWTVPNADVVCPVMIGSLVGLGLGLATRLSAGVLAALYGYTFVLDPLAYNNHYVLVALLAFLLTVVRSHAVWSFDSTIFHRSHPDDHVPIWQVGLLRFQIAIVYFFGGLAKINGDWVRGEPIGPWLREESNLPIIGSLLAHPASGAVVAWYGLLFDLTIPFLLLARRTRPAALVFAVAFHLTNVFLFEIGIFPWLGIASLVLFLDPDTPATCTRWFDRRRTSEPDVPTQTTVPAPRRRPFVVGMLGLYAFAQLVVPCRHLFHAGNVEWTEEGRTFSWRMMLAYKETAVGLRVEEPSTGRVVVVDSTGVLVDVLGTSRGERRLVTTPAGWRLLPSKFLPTDRQRLRRLYNNPRFLARYARFLAEEARAVGLDDPVVRVTAVASLNGRPFQYLVDPTVDLAHVPLPPFDTPHWIVPLEPDQPIGNYPNSREDMLSRVQQVIDR